MPMIIHLGVIDQFYTTPQIGKGAPPPVSTGNVAVWLEDKYGIMQTFARVNALTIALMLEKSLSRAIRTAQLGGPATTNPFMEATAKIETMFKDFLTNDEMAKLGVPGVPTQAAKDGKSSRVKGGRYKKNRKGKSGLTLGSSRPSFIDTGLYQASFKSWYEKR